jgi:hypothetical protein
MIKRNNPIPDAKRNPEVQVSNDGSINNNLKPNYNENRFI